MQYFDSSGTFCPRPGVLASLGGMHQWVKASRARGSSAGVAVIPRQALHVRVENIAERRVELISLKALFCCSCCAAVEHDIVLRVSKPASRPSIAYTPWLRHGLKTNYVRVTNQKGLVSGNF